MKVDPAEKLNDVEGEWVEFLSRKLGKPPDRIESLYIDTKKRFHGETREYARCLWQVHSLHRLLYDAADEKELLEMYKRNDLAHCLLYLSYACRKRPRWYRRWLVALKRAARGDVRAVARHAMRRAAGAPSDTGSYAGIARFLLEKVRKGPVVVDYGCGLAHLSFEIAKQDPEARFYLVDIDCLVLEFAKYRFDKHGFKAESIPVTAESLYPRLPPHDLCIASEVLEHVHRPLEVYDHILESLRPGGALHGEFGDHSPGILHVSPSLGPLRDRVRSDFERIGSRTYLRMDS